MPTYRITGIEEKIAMKKASAWGTPVACGAGDGVVCKLPSIKKSIGFEKDDSLGVNFSRDGVLGPISVNGDLPMYLRYDGCDLGIAMSLGTAGAPTQLGATIAYSYAYKHAANLDGKFVTIAQWMKNFICEHPTAKIVGFTLKGEMGKALELILHVIPINKVFDSSTNTTTTFLNVTFPEIANLVRFSQGVFRMNAQSGGALSSGDIIHPSTFELQYLRKMKGEFTGDYVISATSQDLIDEPTADDVPEITLKLTFPKFTAVTNMAILAADTRQKMDMTFTGGLIASTYYRTFVLQFPHLQLKNDDPADEKGNIKEPLEFEVHGASSAPIGMSGITDPFWVTGQNQRTTDPLG